MTRREKNNAKLAARRFDRDLLGIAAQQCGLDTQDVIVTDATTQKASRIALRGIEALGGVDHLSLRDVQQLGYDLQRTILPATSLQHSA